MEHLLLTATWLKASPDHFYITRLESNKTMFPSYSPPVPPYVRITKVTRILGMNYQSRPVVIPFSSN